MDGADGCGWGIELWAGQMVVGGEDGSIRAIEL